MFTPDSDDNRCSSLRACAFPHSATPTTIWTVGDDLRLLRLRVDAAYTVDAESIAYCGEGHTDSIRALAPAHHGDQVVYTGAYDHTVRAWDGRTATATLVLQHAHGVQALALLANDHVLPVASESAVISVLGVADGALITIWDVRKASSPLCTVGAHHKTITRLCVARNGARLLSASLDCHVKVYDVVDYGVVHTLNAQLPVVSFALSVC